MEEFANLVPPPDRPLTADQHERLRAALPTGDRHERHWLLTTVASAAAVLAVVGGGLVVSHSLSGNDGSVDPAEPGPRANALPFENPSKGTGNMCLQAPPRTVIILDHVTPARDVVVSSVGLLDPHRASIGGTWFTPVRPGSVGVAGAFSEGLPGTSRTILHEWHQRQPLAGATLEAGKTYTFFARLTLTAGGQLKGLRFVFRDGEAAATSDYDQEVVARAKC